MKSLAFLGGALFGAITVASICHDDFRTASKKFIANLSEQISKQIDDTAKTEHQQTDIDNKDN